MARVRPATPRSSLRKLVGEDRSESRALPSVSKRRRTAASNPAKTQEIRRWEGPELTERQLLIREAEQRAMQTAQRDQEEMELDRPTYPDPPNSPASTSSSLERLLHLDDDADLAFDPYDYESDDSWPYSLNPDDLSVSYSSGDSFSSSHSSTLSESAALDISNEDIVDLIKMKKDPSTTDETMWELFQRLKGQTVPRHHIALKRRLSQWGEDNETDVLPTRPAFKHIQWDGSSRRPQEEEVSPRTLPSLLPQWVVDIAK
ncbi:uncharacterized protein F4822DRAFT_444939 [Hypoxylon trugodes]|uniref:uncharacterized protein n=1 Tax=Hypoxylon trugodes TaxID=326681 RepID=UPI0021942498|nr:uncharacterized protein F4822DRAFT_444939 [Hypoxylon trugodes]KAI1386600.1 hypothetical protein F4822DRAFT_444939 [Hypoxylon trugodes]